MLIAASTVVLDQIAAQTEERASTVVSMEQITQIAVKMVEKVRKSCFNNKNFASINLIKSVL